MDLAAGVNHRFLIGVNMARLLFLAGALAVLTGCGGNPFLIEPTTTPTEPVDPADPNTSVNSKFAWDPAKKLTMNKVTYDKANDKLVINNLPFDGPDGIYDNVMTFSNGTTGYKSRTTGTTGQVTHYAVFVESAAMQATAAAGVDWVQYGNAGANVNRSSFKVPDTIGEYIYVGDYAATRTFDSRGGIELVTGDVSLLVDVLDFDPVSGIQGDIVGNITNRKREFSDLYTGPNAFGSTTATQGRDLPDILLAEVSFDGATGTFNNGVASTKSPLGKTQGTGTYSGLFGGATGDQIGGYTVVTGKADVQAVRYELLTYRNADSSEATSSGLTTLSTDAMQTMINAGTVLPSYLAAPAIPPGATLISTEIKTIEIATDYSAREVGVFVGTQLPTN